MIMGSDFGGLGRWRFDAGWLGKVEAVALLFGSSATSLSRLVSSMSSRFCLGDSIGN